MKNEIYSNHTSTLLGTDANLIAMLSYFSTVILGWIPILEYVAFFAPLIVFFIEKDSTFVKFHAMQAFLLSAISGVVGIVYLLLLGASAVGMGLGTVSLETGLVSAGAALVISAVVMIFSIVVLVYEVIAMVGAFKYKESHIPFIGTWAARFAHTDSNIVDSDTF